MAASSPDGGALDRFLFACAAEIDRRLEHQIESSEAIASGAAAFRAALEEGASGAPAPDILRTESSDAPVPVADWLDRLAPTPLVQQAQATTDRLVWTRSPRLEDRGVTAGLSPLNETRFLPGVLAGLLLLAPDAVYPEHHHPPQEIYLPISGSGRWRYGGSERMRRLGPEQLVYNHPNDIHRVEAGADPLLALYVLWPVADPHALL